MGVCHHSSYSSYSSSSARTVQPAWSAVPLPLYSHARCRHAPQVRSHRAARWGQTCTVGERGAGRNIEPYSSKRTKLLILKIPILDTKSLHRPNYVIPPERRLRVKTIPLTEKRDSAAFHHHSIRRYDASHSCQRVAVTGGPKPGGREADWGPGGIARSSPLEQMIHCSVSEASRRRITNTVTV